jgi:hypothetical protein
VKCKSFVLCNAFFVPASSRSSPLVPHAQRPLSFSLQRQISAATESESESAEAVEIGSVAVAVSKGNEAEHRQGGGRQGPEAQQEIDVGRRETKGKEGLCESVAAAGVEETGVDAKVSNPFGILLNDLAPRAPISE